MDVRKGINFPDEASPYRNIHYSKKTEQNKYCQKCFSNKKCKIFIKHSAIIENIKIDFDDVPFQKLRVNVIKKSFPKNFQTRSLHYLAVRYITERILSAAKEKKLCTFFYKDCFSKRRGYTEEPVKMFFFVEEQHLRTVKKVLSKTAVVKLNRITTIDKNSFKKAIKSLKQYDNTYKKRNKMQSKLLQSITKKCLKIDANNYVYVDKHNFKLAKKSLLCKVSIPNLLVDRNIQPKVSNMCEISLTSTELFKSTPDVMKSNDANEISEAEKEKTKVDLKEKELLVPNFIQSSAEVVFKLTVLSANENYYASKDSVQEKIFPV